MTLLPILAAIFFIQGPPADGPSPVELAAMKKLDFLAGKWKGTGETVLSPTEKHKFAGGEEIKTKLHGKALLVEGLFKDETGKVAHETLAIITYDAEHKIYRFNTYLFNRPGGEYELHVEEKGFWWEMVNPGGPTIRFTMKITEKGDWNEVGELRMEGRPAFKFFEMNLTKE